MKKIACYVLCVLAAAGVSSITACSISEPSVTAITTASVEPSGIGNPWKDASTLEEAAYGANLNDFDINEDDPVDGAVLKPLMYRYTDIIAEATYLYKGIHITIRKSTVEYSQSMDISGAYQDYGYEWTMDINGITVYCYGYANGKTVKAVWTNDDLCYSILSESGDNTSPILSDNALKDMVNAIE